MALVGQAFAEEPKKTNWTARVVPSEGSKITGLQMTESNLPVVLAPGDSKLRPMIEVRGRFSREGWELNVDTPSGPKKVKFKDGMFVVYAYLNSRFSDVTFVAKGPNEKSETQKVMLYSPDAQEYRIGSDWGDVVLALGGGTLKYFQTGSGDFESKSAAQILSYSSPTFGARWNFGSSFRMSFWTVSSSPIHADPYFVQLKMNAGFLLGRSAGGHLKWKILGGGNYLTVFGHGAPFGFANLIAPDAGLRLLWLLADKHELVFGANFVPLGNGFDSQLGADVSMGYTYRLENLHFFETSLMYSKYSYVPQKNAKIRTSLLSLTFGYSL